MPELNSVFYPKLAASNLRKNSKAYFPYILSSIFTIVTFYSIFSLAQNPGLSELPGGDVVRVLFCLGVIIVGIFSAALLFYTNSFLIKQRKKELGLYSILGMEKRHIARVLLFEVLFTALISIILGVLGGILIEKLLFLALLALLKIETPVVFNISPSVILITVILFAAIFFLTPCRSSWLIPSPCFGAGNTGSGSLKPNGSSPSLDLPPLAQATGSRSPFRAQWMRLAFSS